MTSVWDDASTVSNTHLTRFGTILAILLVGWGLPKSASAQSMDADVVDHVKQATVLVFTAHSKQTEGDTLLGSGTGFFVNRTGLCISNDHVTDPGHGKSVGEKFMLWRQLNRLSWKVIVNSGTEDEKEYRAQVLYSNDQADMAVMQVYDEDGSFLETPHFLEFYDSEDVTLDMKLWDFGFPGGDRRKQSKDQHAKIAIEAGSVVELPRMPSGRLKWIMTNILANGGNSGGPAVSIDGKMVGIATLAGGGDEGRSAFTILIPANLTRKMIRYAFEEKRLPAGIDIYPFLDSLFDDQRVYSLPAHERTEDHTCVTMDSGSRFCGRPSKKELTWPSPIGEITIPSDRCAYVIMQDDIGTVLLDGGDRFQILRDESVFPFQPNGGEEVELDLSEVASISFERPDRPPVPPSTRVFVIGSEQFHISLTEPSGKVRFEEGDTEIAWEGALTDIARISTNDFGDVVLETVNGSRIVGEFLEHEIVAKHAWSGVSVRITLEELTDAVMHSRNYAGELDRGELPLTESISTTDSRIVRVAQALDADNTDLARSRLADLIDAGTFRSLSDAKRDEVKRMEGEVLLREGKIEESQDVFRRLKNSDIADVNAHALSRIEMFETYPKGKYEGKSISDTAVFRAAGRSLATGHMIAAVRTLEDIERMTANQESPGRSEYRKLVKSGEAMESKLLVANRLSGGLGEEALIRLWRNMSNLHQLEARRLQFERQEFQQNRNGRNATGRQQRQLELRMERFERDIEKSVRASRELQGKMQEAGFIIDDTDRELTDAR